MFHFDWKATGQKGFAGKSEGNEHHSFSRRTLFEMLSQSFCTKQKCVVCL